MAIEREVYVKDEADDGDSDYDDFHDAVGRDGTLEESDHVFHARNFTRSDPTGLWMPLNVCRLESDFPAICALCPCACTLLSYLNLLLFNAYLLVVT